MTSINAMLTGRRIVIPAADLAAVREGDSQAFVEVLVALIDHWMSLSGSHIRYPNMSASEIASGGDTAKAGLQAAALDLRELVAYRLDGRKALADLGFDPVLQDVESE